MENRFVFIRAEECDFELVVNHYANVVKNLERGENYPGWHSDSYPNADTAKSQIGNNQLFLAMNGSNIAGSVALTHSPEKGYENVKFSIDCPYSEIFVIHTLAVSPDFLRCGIGKFLLENCIHKAKQEGMRAIRLDMSPTNAPAQALYSKCGFNLVGTTDINYNNIILKDFKLFEKLL